MTEEGVNRDDAIGDDVTREVVTGDHVNREVAGREVVVGDDADRVDVTREVVTGDHVNREVVVGDDANREGMPGYGANRDGVNGLALVPWSLRRKYTIERLLAQNDESDLYLARTRADEPTQVALRIYRPGLRLDDALLDRIAERGALPYRPGLVDHGRSGSGTSSVTWLVQEHLPGGTLRDLMTGGPWVEKRAREAVTAIAACVSGWRDTLGHDIGDFRPDDLLVRGLDPLVLALGHIRTPAWYGWARPAPPETVEGAAGAPASWWALGVVVHELLTGRPPAFEPGDAAVDHDGAAHGRWQPLLAGLLTVDPAARWTGAQVAAWLAGGTPPVIGDRAYAPLEFAGREHATPAALAMDMAARPGPAESWLADGGDVLLGNWLEFEVQDGRFDRDLLEEAPPMISSAFAATFTAGLRPRYRGFAVDAEGLIDLATGGAHGPLAEVVASGVLAHAARHRCGHPECPDGETGGCRLLHRLDAELPIVLTEVGGVLDRLRGVAGGVSDREWNRGVAIAVELTLDPRATGRYRRRLRLESLSALRRAGAAWVDWWREQRHHALTGRREELGTRAAIVAVLLLTAGAAAEGRRLAEENREELRRRRELAADQGRAVLARLRDAAATAFAELRLRGPGVLREVALWLADRGEDLVVRSREGWRHVQVRTQSRYARLLLSRAEHRARSQGAKSQGPRGQGRS